MRLQYHTYMPTTWLITAAALALLLALWIHIWMRSSMEGLQSPKSYHQSKELKCVQNVKDGSQMCRPVCDESSFSLYGMDSCVQKLDCISIEKEVQKGKLLGQGAVKMVYLANWRGYTVVWNEPNMQNNFTTDYKHGVTMLQELQSLFVTQILGLCNSVVITEYQKLGDARNVNEILDSVFSNAVESSAIFRVQLCIDYAEILSYLHQGGKDKTFVMCDSNDLEKTLSQYLLMADLHLILNDVDSLAVIDNNSGNMIKCGGKELSGDFVAPEQLWPYEDRVFYDSEMPPYNEKTDIWKIPNVCNFFLGSHMKIKLQLIDAHLKCKNLNPNSRPSATEIVQKYKTIVLD